MSPDLNIIECVWDYFTVRSKKCNQLLSLNFGDVEKHHCKFLWTQSYTFVPAHMSFYAFYVVFIL